MSWIASWLACLWSVQQSVAVSLNNDYKSHTLEQHIVIDWMESYTPDRLTHLVESFMLTSSLVVHDVLSFNSIQPSVRTQVMSSFYQQFEDDYRGEYPFTIYLVNDTRPRYDYRYTNNGIRKVNSNMHGLGAFLQSTSLCSVNNSLAIHVTNNIQETKDNLRSMNLFYSYYRARVFSSLSEVFSVLNSGFPNFIYVILRLLDNVPHNNVAYQGMPYVEILVSDYFEAKCILDGDSTCSVPIASECDSKEIYENGGENVGNIISVGKKMVFVDIKWVGDGSYNIKTQRALLEQRIQGKSEAFIADPALWPFPGSISSTCGGDNITDDTIVTVPIQGILSGFNGDKETTQFSMYKGQNPYTEVSCFCEFHGINIDSCHELLHVVLSEFREKISESHLPLHVNLVSTGLSALRKCGLDFVVMRVTDVIGFPHTLQEHKDVDILINPADSLSDYVECLESAYDMYMQSTYNKSTTYRDVTLILRYVFGSVTDNWLVDITLPRSDTFIVRFELQKSVHSSVVAVSPRWSNMILASAVEVISPAGFVWRRPCDSDEAALRVLAYMSAPSKIHHLDWIKAHPKIHFSDPRTHFPSSLYVNEYSECCSIVGL